MVKISMALPDADLALIDQYANGNRTAFMVEASVARAKALRRQHLDAEISAALEANEEADFKVYKEWESTLSDGLDGVE